jgi:hypothetical protein
MTKLPLLLESIRIATPCRADWDDMVGDERVRFCGKCQKNVYNLSEMTRAEAEALVREKQGRMCARLYRRRDGTVLTADCPVGVRNQRLRTRVWAALSSATASMALVLGLVSGRSARADLAVGGDANKGKGTVSEVKGRMRIIRHTMGQIPPQSTEPLPEKAKPPAHQVKMGEVRMTGDIQVPMGDIEVGKVSVVRQGNIDTSSNALTTVITNTK